MMKDTGRYNSITSFLELPKSHEELRWLIKSVQLAKQSSSESMDAFEQEGSSRFRIASEEDPYVEEHAFFSDFAESRKTFHQWLAIEREISHLTQIDTEPFNQDWSGGSQFVQMVASNLVYCVSHEKELLGRAQCDLELAIEEASDYGPENKDDFDDEWFRLQNCLDASNLELKNLEETLPLCWQSLQQFVTSPQLRSYLPSDLIAFVEQNDRENFIASILVKEEQLEEDTYTDEELKPDERPSFPWSTSEDDIPF